MIFKGDKQQRFIVSVVDCAVSLIINFNSFKCFLYSFFTLEHAVKPIIQNLKEEKRNDERKKEKRKEMRNLPTKMF